MTDPRLRRHPFGFLEVVDRPSPEALAAYYTETYYQTERSSYRREYLPEELHAIRLRITQRAAKAQSILGDSRRGRLLDVGCGEGFVMAEFASRGWTVAGIDFSAVGVENMNREMADRVEQGDIFALLQAHIAANTTYDLVWLGNVLEHVLDPIGLMEALRLLVEPGGLLVVTVPNDGNAYHETLLSNGDIDRRFWIAIPDHMSYFTADSLKITAKATGWDTLAIIGDFPIDFFLAHPGSNYVANPALGRDAHRARLKLEAIVGAAGPEAANRFYSALAEVGFGRNLTAFLRPKTEGTAT
ncbi:class I SAM-dependent methyltransferase [Rhizobium anhuiense]|uniref:Class I SAM-dependent methyltransferase n=1 Tax=Rhizobium anhuiense TaxID=1184720 RepID=A0A3S0SR46_9HYPH|nr:class I SAM-dependent methyltransferase [Rhizobium anhuiense]RUL98256.1 class I SAM-dependent methyltransferase [Rhizobium anhuiense]GGE00164.1 hypothetical protein GCM10008012_49590 [Rhizobium anhuiense]